MNKAIANKLERSIGLILPKQKGHSSSEQHADHIVNSGIDWDFAQMTIFGDTEPLLSRRRSHHPAEVSRRFLILERGGHSFGDLSVKGLHGWTRCL